MGNSRGFIIKNNIMKKIKPEEFFKKVCVASGVSDLQTVKNIYYGLVKTVSRELRTVQFVEMPDWGKFHLHIYKSRRTTNVNNGQIIVIPPKLVVKYIADWKVKKYFASVGVKEGLGNG